MSTLAEQLDYAGIALPTHLDRRFLQLLEEHLARRDDQIARVAMSAGRIKSILDHSRDRCDAITELRGEFNDLLAALGVAP